MESIQAVAGLSAEEIRRESQAYAPNKAAE
jgi:hypothetical protein